MKGASKPPLPKNLAHQANRWDEAVVEAAHMDDASRLRRLPHLARLVGVHAKGFLAEDVFARLDRGHRRPEVQDVGRAVVEDLDRRVLHYGMPVGDAFLVAIPARGGLHLLRIAAADGDE